MNARTFLTNLFATNGKTNKRLDAASELALMTAGFAGGSHRHLVGVPAPYFALRNSVVYSCVKLLSETLATLPVRLIDRESKQDINNHPVSRLIQAPNPDQTWVDFLEMVLCNYFTHGNAYVELEIDRGRVTGLYPMNAARTIVIRADDRLVYEFTPTNGKSITLTDANVMHLRMFGMDNLCGTSPLWAAERAITLSLTQEEMSIQTFADGARPDYVITLPPEKALERLQQIDAESLKQDKATIQAQIEGAKTRRGLYVPFGYACTPYQTNFQQSQFVETRDFQITELSRIWRVPPSKLGVLSKSSTGATSTQEQLSFYQDTLRPVITKIEKRLERDLLSDADRQRYQIKFNVRAILRGDIATQTDQYVKLWQIGSLTTNEIREMEDLPAFEDDRATKPNFPFNMTTESIAGASQPTNPADGGIASGPNQGDQGTIDPPKRANIRAFRAISDTKKRSLDARKKASRDAKPAFKEAMDRIVRKEIAVVTKDATSILGKRSATNLKDRLRELYSGELKDFITDNIRGPVQDVLDSTNQAMSDELNTDFDDQRLKKMAADYVSIFVRDYTRHQLYKLSDTIDDSDTDADILPNMKAALAKWDEDKADNVSNNEPSRAMNVFSKGMYALAGVQLLEWVASSPCPICEPLDGKTFSVKNAPDVPRHNGCDCNLVAA